MELYETLEEARKKALKMSEILETTVLITKEVSGKYALFGHGEVVEKVE